MSELQFVTVTKPGSGWKNGNEHVVRSHAMKFVRRRGRLDSQSNTLTDGSKVKAAKKKHLESSNYHTSQGVEATSNHAQAPTRRASDIGRLKDSELDDTVRKYNRGRSLVQQPAIHHLTRAEYRLLSHVSTLYSPLLDNVSHNNFLVWRKGVKQFMAIAFSSDYTMHAILAWSATHLSQMTGDPKVKQQMYHHRFHAFQGLQKAVRELSLENADAALCASIVMSWQASDASTWMNLIRGSQAVKDTMTSWQCQSTLSDSTKSSDALVHSTTLFPMLFDALDHVVPRRRSDAQRTLLAEAHLSLRVLQVTVSDAPDLYKATADLTSFIESVQDEQETITSLQPLKDMLFWFPTRFIPILNTSPAVMILMAHLHAIALFVGPVDDPNSVLFRSLNVAPIEAFYEEFMTRYRTARETGDVGNLKMNEDSLRMMQFPMQAVTEFHTRARLSGEYPTVLRRSQLRIGSGE